MTRCGICQRTGPRREGHEDRDSADEGHRARMRLAAAGNVYEPEHGRHAGQRHDGQGGQRHGGCGESERASGFCGHFSLVSEREERV